MNIPQVDPDWAACISEEIEQLKQRGYRFSRDFDNLGRAAYIRIFTERDTQAGPQPVTIYLELDQRFPQQAPTLKVGISLQRLGPDGELMEIMIDVDSKTRLTWAADNYLYEVVADLEEMLRSPTLKIIPTQPYEHWPPVHPSNGAEPAHGTPPPPPPRKRITSPLPSLDEQTPAERPVAAKVEEEVGPRPAKPAQDETSEHLPGKPAGPPQQPHLPIWQRSTPRWALLVVIGLLAIALISALAFRSVPFSDDSEVAMFWAQLADLQQGQPLDAMTVNQLERTAATLGQIHSADSDARRPSDGTPAERLLLEAYLALGDRIYAQDSVAAAGYYRRAESLLPRDPEVLNRLRWVTRDEQIAQASLVTWPTLIAEMGNEAPNLRDPAGRTVAERLYAVRVDYGLALLERTTELSDGVAIQRDAEAAWREAEAARALSGIGDTSSAEELQKRAQAVLETSGNYRIEIDYVTEATWQELIAERLRPVGAGAATEATPTLTASPALTATPVLATTRPNLLLLTPVSNMLVRLVPEGQAEGQPLLSNRLGIATASINEGTYKVQLEDGGFTHKVVIRLSSEQPYCLVRIVPR